MVVPVNPTYDQLVTGVQSISANKLEVTFRVTSVNPTYVNLSNFPFNFQTRYSGYLFHFVPSEMKIYAFPNNNTSPLPSFSNYYVYDITTNTWTSVSMGSVGGYDMCRGRNGIIYINDVNNRQIKSYNPATKVATTILTYAGIDNDWRWASTSYDLKFNDFVYFLIDGGSAVYKLNLTTNAWTKSNLSLYKNINGDTTNAFCRNFSTNYSYAVVSKSEAGGDNSYLRGYLISEYSETITTIFVNGGGTVNDTYDRLLRGYSFRGLDPTNRNAYYYTADLGFGRFFNFPAVADFNKQATYAYFNYNDFYKNDNYFYYPLVFDTINKETYFFKLLKSGSPTFHKAKVGVSFEDNQKSNGNSYSCVWRVEDLVNSGVKIKLLQNVTEVDGSQPSGTVVRQSGYIVTKNMYLLSSSNSIRVELTLP